MVRTATSIIIGVWELPEEIFNVCILVALELNSFIYTNAYKSILA